MNQFRVIAIALLSFSLVAVPGQVFALSSSVPDLDSGSDTGSSDTDNLTNDSTPVFSGTIDEAADIWLYVNSVQTKRIRNTVPPVWNYTYSTVLADGTYTFAATPFVPSGSSGPLSDSLTVTIDATAPVVTLTGDSTVTVEGGAPYDDAGASATDTRDGTLTPAITSNTVNVAVAGTYSVTYSATDTAGNTGTATRTVIVTEAPPDTTAPVLTQVTPVSQATNDPTPSYVFTSTESGTITYGGDCSSSTTDALAGDTTITFSTLADGEHANCTITVTDTAGNSGSVAVTSFTVDTTGPVITLSGDATMTVTQGTTFLDPGATASDARDGSVSVTVGGDTVNTNVLGTYSITYNAEDSLNNAATEVTRTVSVVEAVRESSGGGGSSRRKSSRDVSSGSVLGASTYYFTNELSPGMSGPDVTALQEVLMAEGLFQGSATGFYGALTYAAVQAYQTKYGLPALGKVGPQTLALLNQGRASVASMTDAERLTRLSELLTLLQKLQALLLLAQASGR